MGGEDADARRRYWLLRYSRHEAEFWFKFLCCSVLSTDTADDYRRLNPFIKDVEAILDEVLLAMLYSTRVVQVAAGRIHQSENDTPRRLALQLVCGAPRWHFYLLVTPRCSGVALF